MQGVSLRECKHTREFTRGIEYHTNGHVPQEKEATVVWTHDKEWIARATCDQARSAQDDSTRGKAKKKTTEQPFAIRLW